MELTPALLALHTAGMRIGCEGPERWRLTRGAQTQTFTSAAIIALVAQMADQYPAHRKLPPLQVAQILKLLRSDQVTVEIISPRSWETRLMLGDQSHDAVYALPCFCDFGTAIAQLTLAVLHQLGQPNDAQLADAQTTAGCADALQRATSSLRHRDPALSAALSALGAALQPLGLLPQAITPADDAPAAQLTMVAGGQQITFAVEIVDAAQLYHDRVDTYVAALVQRMNARPCIPVLITADAGGQSIVSAAAARRFTTPLWIVGYLDEREQQRWVSAPIGHILLDVQTHLRSLRQGA